MKAFLNDKKLKADMLSEITKHEKADQIEKGHYGKENGDWKGCAVSCSLRSLAIIKGEELVTLYKNHKRYETDLGIPRALAHLEDGLFESLTEDKAKTFPREFIKAIPVGSDLSLVINKFLVWLLTDEKNGVIKYADEQGKKSITHVAELHQKIIDGQEVIEEEWDAAWAAAKADARAATWDASRAAAGAATWDVAWDDAAWAASRAAARAATWDAARDADAAWDDALDAQKKKLIELLKEAPIVEN